MQLKEFNKCFLQFMAGYPNFTPKDTAETLKAYFEVLEEFPVSALKEALHEVSKSGGEFFPSVGSIYYACCAHEETRTGEEVYLRPLHFCYKEVLSGSIKYAVDKKTREKKPMVCGCRDCDPVGFAQWEMKYAAKKSD